MVAPVASGVGYFLFWSAADGLLLFTERILIYEAQYGTYVRWQVLAVLAVLASLSASSRTTASTGELPVDTGPGPMFKLHTSKKNARREQKLAKNCRDKIPDIKLRGGTSANHVKHMLIIFATFGLEVLPVKRFTARSRWGEESLLHGTGECGGVIVYFY